MQQSFCLNTNNLRVFGCFEFLCFIQNEAALAIFFHLKIRNRHQDLLFYPVMSLRSVLFYKHSLQCYVLDGKPNEAEITLYHVEIINANQRFRNFDSITCKSEECDVKCDFRMK